MVIPLYGLCSLYDINHILVKHININWLYDLATYGSTAHGLSYCSARYGFVDICLFVTWNCLKR